MTTEITIAEMNKEPKYLYYEVTLTDCSQEWDVTICETLNQVLGVLRLVDIDFDDLERMAMVHIRGIGMTRKAYAEWKKENNLV